MIVLANFLAATAYILDTVIFIAIILVIARAVVSWVSADPYNPIVRFLAASTDPLLLPLRRRIPLSAGGVDFSPLLLLFLLYFLQIFLVQTIRDYALQLRLGALSLPPQLSWLPDWGLIVI